jgi:hypothetical protein
MMRPDLSVIEFMAMALRWGYESRVDEENEAWPPAPVLTFGRWYDQALERERADAELPPARPRFDDPDWPPVAVPGTGVRLGPGSIAVVTSKPSDCYPAEPGYVRFPTLDEQAAWLNPEDIAFCRRYAREHP